MMKLRLKRKEFDKSITSGLERVVFCVRSSFDFSNVTVPYAPKSFFITGDEDEDDEADDDVQGAAQSAETPRHRSRKAPPPCGAESEENPW